MPQGRGTAATVGEGMGTLAVHPQLICYSFLLLLLLRRWFFQKGGGNRCQKGGPSLRGAFASRDQLPALPCLAV